MNPGESPSTLGVPSQRPSFEALISLVYAVVRRLAADRLVSERRGHTLEATIPVHLLLSEGIFAQRGCLMEPDS